MNFLILFWMFKILVFLGGSSLSRVGMPGGGSVHHPFGYLCHLSCVPKKGDNHIKGTSRAYQSN